MVVDGHIELVGSDERRAIRAVESATNAAKAQLSLSAIRFDGANKVSLHLEAGPLPSSVSAKSANLFLAIADDSDESHVSRGENAGRTLKHVAVLRELVPVGTVGRTDKFSQDITVNRMRQRNAPSAREASVMKWGNERKTHAWESSAAAEPCRSGATGRRL